MTLTPVPLSKDPVLHLVRRTTYGPTPAAVARARSIGRVAWLDEQLAARLDDSACQYALRRFPEATRSSASLVSAGRSAGQAALVQLQRATLLRQMFSTRQLYEQMVEVWADHFCIKLPSEKVMIEGTDFDRLALRPYALGRFADLLKAVVRSPAMLSWLDNKSSRKESPNENLGRELLELFTVGSGAGYTEAHVRDSSRILTGWTYDATKMTFVFREKWHDTGAVQVLGFSAPAHSASTGLQVGTSYLDYLARHPRTATRVARRLAVRFVQDNPPAALVDRLAQVYLQNDTAIRPVLRALFLSSEFSAAVGGKLRRPGEAAVAAVRVLGGRPSSDTAIEHYQVWHTGLQRAGHEPRGWPEPDGYPDRWSAWVGAAQMVGRWNLNQRAAAHLHPGVVYPTLVSLYGSKRPTTCGAFVDGMARRLLFQTLSSADRAAVLRFLGKGAADPVPSYFFDPKGRIKHVATLMLDSPYFALR